MANYTDDMGEMDGLLEDTEPITDVLPSPEVLKNAPTRIFKTMEDGTEQTLEYRYPSQVRQVVISEDNDIILELDDGQKITAHLAEGARITNEGLRQ